MQTFIVIFQILHPPGGGTAGDGIVDQYIDPAGILRMSSPEKVREETLALLDKCAKYPNFVLSSGCDMPPLTPWENIDAFFASVKEFYGK